MHSPLKRADEGNGLRVDSLAVCLEGKSKRTLNVGTHATEEEDGPD